MRIPYLFLLITGLAAAYSNWPTTPRTRSRSFSVDYRNGHFLLDGQPYSYQAGEAHYFRMHPSQWRNRLAQMVEIGLNTVQFYIPWNYHEVFEGEFNFDDDRDFAEFARIAGTLGGDYGMNAIIRIGPYICSEWENGGLPWFVTMNENITLRSMDPIYLGHVKRWFDTLLPKIKPLLMKNGGNVMMIQIENEYGLYHTCDNKYMKWLRDLVWSHLGNDVVLFTTDPVDGLKCGVVEGVLPTIDFGPTSRETASKYFKYLKTFMPNGQGPLVNSEFYSGWFTTWGLRDQTLPTNEEFIDTLMYMFELKISFSIYMAFGGTNFGYWNGAESSGPIVTSYDYGAPIREDGTLRSLYTAIGNAIFGRAGGRPDQTYSIPKIEMKRVSSPFITSSDCSTENVTSFEEFGVPYGFYTTDHYLHGLKFTNNVFAYTYTHSEVEFHNHTSFLYDGPVILENEGRLTYPASTGQKRFGMNSERDPNSRVCALLDSDIWSAAISSGNQDKYTAQSIWGDYFARNPTAAGGLYVGRFHNLNQSTHFDMSNWGKGVLFVNGHNMGRYWNIGPQQSLYVPGAYLGESPNIVAIYELFPVHRGCIAGTCVLRSSTAPIWHLRD